MDTSNDPQYRTDDGSALRIWKDAAQNKFLSEQQGRAIFDEVTYVEVISPGSQNSSPIFEVKRVFAAEMGRDEPKFSSQYPTYEKYVKDFEATEGRDASLAGTPLSQWSEVTRTMGASLKAHGVFTVEALANLPDTKLSIVGPDGRTWREKAKAYIENAKNGSFATALAAENERLKADLAAQQKATAELAAKVETLMREANTPDTAKPAKVAKPASDII